MYFQQNQITYPGANNDSIILESIDHRRVAMTTPDGELIAIHRKLTNSPSTLIYFGGNAQDIAGMLHLSEEINVGSFYGLNYRGYGSGKYRSDGSASEEALRKDAEHFIQTLVNSENIAPEHIIIMGQSLGSAVAIHAAEYIERTLPSSQKAKGLILITPFSSMAQVAKSHYPWLPIQWLIKSPWHNEARAKKLTTPALFILAKQDQVTPPKLGIQLYQIYGGAKTQSLLERGHNDIHLDDEYFPTINRFIDGL